MANRKQRKGRRPTLAMRGPPRSPELEFVIGPNVRLRGATLTWTFASGRAISTGWSAQRASERESNGRSDYTRSVTRAPRSCSAAVWRRRRTASCSVITRATSPPEPDVHVDDDLPDGAVVGDLVAEASQTVPFL